jgi:hypothetical protein
MMSVIPVHLETGISDKASTENLASPQLIGPNITITPPTDTTPGGKIFEDAVRGTIFWEAADLKGDVAKSNGDTWGNIFRVEWIRW